MVEHIWIRLAELREDAVLEEWEAKRPCLARWRRRYMYWRVQCLLLLKEARESERGQRLHDFTRAMFAHWLRLYLALTRCVGRRPSRRQVQTLSTRGLISELDERNIDRSSCVERGDLLDALCGPEEHMAEPLLTSDPDEAYSCTADKMV